MSRYHHILVALDLSADETESIVERAVAIGEGEAKITLLHVIEPMNFAYGWEVGAASVTNIEDNARRATAERLAEIGARNGIDEQDQVIILGRAADGVHRMAKEGDVDLIVIGSHGRHGMGLLLGSTANAVLHGATCDVLAVRVGAHG